MQGRAFLDIARELVSGGTESHWRATVVQAYYSLFLECRDALTGWRIAVPLRQNVHTSVRLRYLYAANSELKKLGRTLDEWCLHRNHASYHLSTLAKFTSEGLAQDSLTEITAALALLDAIESDPMRRAAAIASFPP